MTFTDFVNSWTTFLLLAAILVAILLDIQVRTNQMREKKKHDSKNK